MSIGIAVSPHDGGDFETLLKRADIAMYEAKGSGKNTFSFFSDCMNDSALEHLHMHGDLKQALNKEEFILYYQPQINASTGTIIGAEALLRWMHPIKGLIMPSRFIHVAESNGMIIPIEDWTLHEACRQAAQWDFGQITPLSVSVNISAMQFKRGNLESSVRSALDKSGLCPEKLELELTESILILDTDRSLETVRNLKALGVRISIDDFGTGYSSMAYLRRFAADMIKIDRSFVNDIVTNPDNAAIVQAIVQMAKSLGMKTIAEGVEDRKTLDYLKGLSCDLIQGFFYSRPLSGIDFGKYCLELFRT